MGKGFGKVLAVLGTAAAMAAILWAGGRALERSYVLWNGALLPRDAQSLTLSGKTMRRPEAFLRFADLRQLDARNCGMTVEVYEWLVQQMPQCGILWDVPVQGKFYPQETGEIAVEELTDEDIHALQYLPELTVIDTGTWQDYDRIQALQEQYPNCRVHYRIALGEDMWDCDVVSLVAENADAEELSRKLGRFSRLESVMLTGSVPQLQVLSSLQQQFPDVFFLWKIQALGRDLETDMEYLDLSGADLSGRNSLEELLPFFSNMKTIRLDNSGLEEEDCIALAKQFPDIQFVFDITIGEHTLRTDATEIDISNTLLESTEQIENLLPCFHDLQKVVMCRCGISSEDMDAMNRRYEDIRFVWSVELAGMEFRTDAVHFTPNRWGLKCTDENIYDLRYCTDMVCVDVGHAFRLTNCEWVRYMPELKYLILAETGIKDLSPLTDHRNLIFLELFLSKVTDYSPLITCKALEDLNLCYTRGSYKPVAEMTWLKRLWWSGNWKARTNLPDLMPESVYMEFLSTSSTGRGWREGQHYYDMRDFIGMEYMVG